MSKVVLLKCAGDEEIYAAVKQAVSMLGGIEKYVKPGNKVLIKPNVLCAQDYTTGATTNPLLVKTIADLCLEAGAEQVIVGESSNWGIDSMAALLACDYGRIADGSRIILQDFKKHLFVKKKIKGLVLSEIFVPEAIEKADVVINCPVLKTHTMTKVTIGIKNFSVGISSDADKQCRLHRIGLYPPITEEAEKHGSWLDCAIADINSHVKTTLTVVDGILGLHGMGAPLYGVPVHSKLILAGDDRVAVDAVGSRILGFDAKEVHHIRNSYDYGMGEIELDRIEILGDSLDEFKFEIHQSYNPSLKNIPSNVHIVNGCKACQACLSTVTYVLSRHREDIEKMEIPIYVYVGKHFQDRKMKPERAMQVFYGNCAGSHIYGGGFVPGCPPRSRRQFIQAIGALDIYRQDEGLDTDR